ncbi:MAG: hypothetical protein QOJ65_1202, partial [Fimbriimonadaceae bacterium]|nr:hypothetical protein [Fimbriimonadaceae bacterium]
SALAAFASEVFARQSNIALGATSEASFAIALSPFYVVKAAGTHTALGGINLPNWLLFAVLAAFVTRLFLLGAASALSGYHAAETKNLRITGLVTAAIAMPLISMGIFSQFYGMKHESEFQHDLTAGVLLAFLPMLMLVLLPFLTCSGSDGEKKFASNGSFSFREAIRGTPAGALPYVLMLLGISALGVLGGFVAVVGALPGPLFLSTIVWAIGFWVFSWSLGRWASSATTELRSARTLHVAAMVVVFGLPLPFLALIDAQQESALWSLYPVFPTILEEPGSWVGRVAMGVALLAIGGIVAYAAVRKQASRRQEASAA